MGSESSFHYTCYDFVHAEKPTSGSSYDETGSHNIIPILSLPNRDASLASVIKFDPAFSIEFDRAKDAVVHSARESGLTILVSSSPSSNCAGIGMALPLNTPGFGLHNANDALEPIYPNSMF